MPLSESLEQQAIRELGETVCPGCAGPKQRKRSFCGPCYFSLPPAMQKALYKPLSEGYATAYDEAKTWLKVER